MNDSCQVLFITQTCAVFKFLRGLHCSASALHGSTPPSLCKAGLSKGDGFGFPSQGPSLQTVGGKGEHDEASFYAIWSGQLPEQLEASCLGREESVNAQQHQLTTRFLYLLATLRLGLM